jgi:hypothetical protein
MLLRCCRSPNVVLRYPPADARSQEGVPKYPALVIGVAMIAI